MNVGFSAGETPQSAADSVVWFPAKPWPLDPRAARMADIAASIRRPSLKVLARAEAIAEWIDLALAVRVAQPAPPRGGKQPADQGIHAAVRDLSIDRRDAQRAVKIARLSDDAKQAAIDAGLADNQTALLQAAKAPCDRQADALRDYKPHRATKQPETDGGLAVLHAAWSAAGDDARKLFLGRIAEPDAHLIECAVVGLLSLG